MTSRYRTGSTTQARNGTSRSMLCLSALSLAVASASSAYAQSGVTSLEEIVVTASRRAEGVQSVPTSIAVVSGADIDDRGAHNFKELSEAISGLELKQPEGHVSSAIYIRGVGTAGTSPADTSVGVVVDNVYQVDLGNTFAEMMDVERVEVLRGPQGTLFGKNTTAGVVRIETRDPDTREFSGRLQGVAGNLDTRELRGVVNIPLIEGTLGARFSGYTAERDGYTDNHFVGEDTRNADREGWRGKLLWTPSDWLRVEFSAEQFEQQSDIDQALVRYPDDLKQQFGDILPPISVGDYQQQHSEVWDEVDSYILNVSLDLPNHTLTSISAFSDLKRFILTDQDFTVLGPELGPRFLTQIDNLGDKESTTQEFQLTSNWDGPLNYIVGAFWQNEDSVSSTNLYFGGSQIPLARPPSLRDVDNKAVFGNISYEFNDKWDSRLGARYTEDETQGSNSQFEGVETFDEVTYSLKVRHHIDADKMAYIAYDKGFKSGGVNREFNLCGRGGQCLSPDQALWDPELTYNYEVGLKSQWLNNRLRLNGALFYQTYEDYQVSRNIPGTGNVLLANAAEVESKGLEADFAWMVSDHLTFSGNMSYIQTEYDEYEQAPCAVPDAPDCNNGAQDLSGETLDNAPELTYSLTGEYRRALPETNNVEWFSRLDLSYQDDHNLQVLLPEETEQDDYYLLNARVGLESPGSWKVAAWGRNLGDEDYLTSAELTTAGLRAYPGISRTYGVTVDWFF